MGRKPEAIIRAYTITIRSDHQLHLSTTSHSCFVTPPSSVDARGLLHTFPFTTCNPAYAESLHTHV
eukprot:4803610-Pleurochrysis_carterae.AAC.2